MLAKICTILVGIGRVIGNRFGYELDVIITDHKIDLQMVDPDKTGLEGRAWEDKHFVDGNIHLKGYANAIKPSAESIEENEDVDYIVSERYKEYMKNSLVSDIVSAGMDQSRLNLVHVVVILTTVQTFMTVFLFLML